MQYRSSATLIQWSRICTSALRRSPLFALAFNIAACAQSHELGESRHNDAVDEQPSALTVAPLIPHFPAGNQLDLTHWYFFGSAYVPAGWVLGLGGGSTVNRETNVVPDRQQPVASIKVQPVGFGNNPPLVGFEPRLCTQKTAPSGGTYQMRFLAALSDYNQYPVTAWMTVRVNGATIAPEQRPFVFPSGAGTRALPPTFVPLDLSVTLAAGDVLDVCFGASSPGDPVTGRPRGVIDVYFAVPPGGTLQLP